ncbi:sensor histidine kinase [Vallitalea okinawensis]|uniref:sensor histidine kinase n=1 Tax=Vallitalea okinawensis TaxID=2078660 RepID=UPI000CFB043F|nr:ATP-binding protein [Vallitalea okinawensis]
MDARKLPIKKISNYIKVLCVSQIILILVLLGVRLLVIIKVLDESFILQADFLLLISSVLLITNCIIMFVDIKWLFNLSNEISIKDHALTDIEALNRQLRAQRHDFLNHIQVLYSLVELEEYQEAAEYMNKLYGDIEGLNKHIKTDHVAINALLLAKSNTAREHKIKYDIDIKSKLTELKIPPWEMCRCLGNLIDNSITVLSKKEGPKYIQTLISETINKYEIKVTNNGEAIDEAIKNKIFMPGFTTKKEEGHGMGLYIVQSIIHNYEGEIEVKSNDKATSFILTLPKGNIHNQDC